MADEKVYTCPSCSGEFTNKERHKAGRKCPHCGVEIDLEKKPKPKGQKGVEYIPIVRGAMVEPAPPPKEEYYELQSSDGANPRIYKLKVNFREMGKPLWRVVYKNVFEQTRCICPACGSYAVTSQMISGGSMIYGPCQRTAPRTGSESRRCKAIVEFVFEGHPVVF